MPHPSVDPVKRWSTRFAANTALFDEVLRKATIPVLVDFWAAWCGTCRAAAPEVARTAAAMAGKAIVLKVDTEAQPGVAVRYGVRELPTFVVLKGGKTVFLQTEHDCRVLMISERGRSLSRSSQP